MTSYYPSVGLQKAKGLSSSVEQKNLQSFIEAYQKHGKT